MALTTPVFGNLTTSTGLPAAPINQTVSYTTNGFSQDVTQTQFPLQLGVPSQPIYMFRVIPAESSSTASQTCVASSQTISASGSTTLQLKTTSTSGTASGHLISTIAKSITFNGKTAIMLDCERCLTFSFVTATTQIGSATIEGYDYRGIPMTIAVTIPADVTDVIVTNPISIVTSIVINSSPYSTSAGLFGVGNSAYIGLPYLCSDYSQIVSVMFENIVFQSDSYADLIALGNDWRENPPTSGLLMNENPTRGTVNIEELTSADNGSAVLQIVYYVAGADSELNANVQNLNQSALAMLGVQTTTSGVYALPYIVEPDLIGLQWNDSNTPTTQVLFINAYVDLLAS